MSKVDERKISSAFASHSKWKRNLSFPYTVKASEKLLSVIGKGMTKGITATAPGFFAPQGRELRLKPSVKNLERKLSAFRLTHGPSHAGEGRISPLRIINFG